MLSRSRQFGTSAEVSERHFGTGAELSGRFGTSLIVPKCLGSEVSWVRSVLTPHIGLHRTASDHMVSHLTKLETSAPATHRLYTSSKPRTGAKQSEMSFIIFTYDVSLLEENPLFHAAAVQSAENPQWTTKPLSLRTILLTYTECYRHVRNR